MRILVTLMTGFLLLAGGCSRQIDKVTDADTFPSAPCVLSDISLDIGDMKVALSWETDTTGEIDFYLIYRSDSTASDFFLRDSSTTNSYVDLSVQNNKRYYYQVSAVSKSGIEGSPSTSVSGVPGLFSIRIEGNDGFTNSRNISIVTVFPSGTTHIMLSNGDDFSESVWGNAVSATTWNLPDQDGIHTVYAKFKMYDGNESNDIVSDDITLDRIALIENFTSDDDGGILTSGDVIHFRMVTGETGGEAIAVLPVVGEIELFDNGTTGDQTADDGIYELDYTIPPTIEFENGAVTGTFQDIATNLSPEATIDHTITVRNSPSSVALYLNGAFEDRIELAWTESHDDDFASYRVYRSESATVDETSHFVAKLNSASQLSVTDTNVASATTYHYVVIVSDQTGLTASSNTLTVTTRENTPPSPVVVAHVKTDSTTFELNWTRNRDADFESYRIYRSKSPDVSNDQDDLLAIENSQSTASYTGDDEGETYYYIIFVYDRLGLASEGSNIVPAAGP